MSKFNLKEAFGNLREEYKKIEKFKKSKENSIDKKRGIWYY